MVSRALRRRTEQVRWRVPVGCPACRSWPLVWLVGEGDPEPPWSCGQCGRPLAALTRIELGLRLADV